MKTFHNQLPKIIFHLCLGLVCLFLSTSCAPARDASLFASKCENDNLNCLNAVLNLQSTGGSQDIASQNLVHSGSGGSATVKGTRYQERSAVSFEIKNIRLVPLKNFTLELTPSGSGYTIENSQSDNCLNVSFLLYSQSCRFVISYTPGAVPVDQNIKVKYKTFIGEEEYISSAVGGAWIISDFFINSADLNFPNTLIYDVSDAGYFERDITVTNYGTRDDITQLKTTLTPTNDFTLVSSGAGYCADGQSLTKSGGSCKVKIRFKPTSSGFKTATLQFSGTGVTRSYTLNGWAKSITGDVNSLSFGAKLTSSTAVTKSITITTPATNGNPAAQSCSYSISGSNRFTIDSNTCTPSMNAAGTCDVTVKFTPDSAADFHNGTLTASCNSRGGALNWSLSARSVTTPLLTDISTIEFGNILLGSSATRQITFTNEGSLGQLTSFTRSLASSGSTQNFAIAGDTCGSSLNIGSSCQTTVRFAPTTSSAAINSTLNASSTQTAITPGLVAQGAGLSVQATATLLDFGSLLVNSRTNSSAAFILNPSTFESTSSCSLETASAEEQGFTFESSDCTSATTLAAGATCSIRPKFTANATLGIKTAIITYNCAVGGSASITLRAETVADLRLLALPPISIVQTGRLVGTTTTQSYTFYNGSNTDIANNLSITTPGISSPWSRISAGSNDCSSFANLNPSETCVVTLQYQPSAAFGSEQVGATSGIISASAASGTINPTDPTYSATAVKITPSVTSLDLGTLPTGSDYISTTLLTMANPSTVDIASGCTLSASSPFQIINSTCGSTLNSNSNCSLNVKLPSQSNSANLSGYLNMDCTVGGRAQIALSAYAQKSPTLAWSGSANYGNVDIGQSSSHTLTLTHSGAALDAAATNLSLALTSSSSNQFSILSHTCPTTLNPGNSCTVNVRFLASTTGSASATLRASSSEVGNTDLPLSATGIDSSTRLVPSITSLNFSSRLVGVSVDTDITVSNTSTAGDAQNVSIGNPSSGSPWTLGASPSPCGTTLANANSCVIRLNYNPTATGSTSGTVTLSSSTMSPSPKTISYSATATKISANRSQINFGMVDVNTAKTHTTVLKITNPSSIDNATGCSLTVGSPFTITGSTCGASLNTGSTCNFQVQLPAQSVEQTYSTSATMSCSVGGNASIAVTAQVKDIPNLTWQGNPDFDKQDIDSGTTTKTFTFKNNETQSVSLAGLGFASGSAASFVTLSGGTCTATTTLAASGSASDSCTVILGFDPSVDTTATDGETATYQVQGTSPVSWQYNLDLVGIGTTMSLVLSSDSLAFNAREVGQTGSQSQSVTLTNSGTRTANLTYSTLSNPPFARSGTCGASLAAGSTCNLAIEATAAASAAVHSATLMVTDTLNGFTKTKNLSLSGETLPIPALQLIDNRGNTTYSNSIASSDITGPTDDTNNIVNLSPTSRDVTYTFKNNVSGSATLNSLSSSLTYQAGTNSTMSKVSDSCQGTNLATNTTCTIVVRYTPTSNSENSTYQLTVSGISAVGGNTYSAQAVSIIGRSLRGASLSLAATLDVGPIVYTSTGQTGTYTLTNTGDQTATNLSYSFSGTDSSNFSRDTGVGSACGSTLAGGASCNIRLNFNPSNTVGVFSASFVIAGDQSGDSISRSVRGSTYEEPVIGNNDDGIEGDITADSSRYYLASRLVAGSNTFKPLLTICPKTTKGAVDSANCTRNDLGSILGAASDSNLAGNLAGSGPRVAQYNNKIVVVVQNKDTNLGGESTGGNATVIVCQKPTSGNSISQCEKFIVNSSAQSGQFPSLIATSNKVIVSTTGSNKNLLLTACTYDSTTSSTTTSTLDLASCVTQDFTTADQGWYTSLAYNNGQAVVTTYEKKTSAPTSYGLRVSACSIASDNTMSNCTSSLADTSSVTDGSDTLYPGAYPQVVLDGSTIYTVHQLGETIKMRLRLTKCSINTSNVVSSCSNQEVTSANGSGATPRLALSGTSASGKLWISAVSLSDPIDNASAGTVKVYQCNLPLSGSSCTGVSSHFTQTSSKGWGPIYNRSSYLDVTQKILVLPFEATYSTHNRKNGVVNLGLYPEL